MVKSQTNKWKSNFLTKLNTTWTTIIAGCTLLSIGFGAGYYIADVIKKIEINEINQKHNENLYNQKKEFDRRTDELIHRVNILELQNGKLQKQ